MDILSGNAWFQYLAPFVTNKSGYKMQVDYGAGAYKYQNIYKVGGYYFCFSIPKGYKKLSSLKKAISRVTKCV